MGTHDDSQIVWQRRNSGVQNTWGLLQLYYTQRDMQLGYLVYNMGYSQGASKMGYFFK